MHLSPPVAWAVVRSKAVVLLLLTFCLLLLPLWESVIVLCFVVRYFMSILVLQSSWWGRESWLLYLICLPGVSWWLSGSSSRCQGVVCSLWLWYFLIILTYYLDGNLSTREWPIKLVMVYHITYRLIGIPGPLYLHPSALSTRGHTLRYMIPNCRTDVYRNSFFPSAIRLWNQLPETIVTAPTLDDFKMGLASQD